MLFLIALLVAVAFSFLCDKQLKKHPTVFYTAAAILTAVTVTISQLESKGHIDIGSEFVVKYIIGIFTRGALGAAFWAVVMWAGALPNGSAPIKKLMPIRGELSITAAILTFSHIITYGIQYISDLINDRTGSGDALRDFVITSIVSLVMVLIMTPLTVMSFKKIRKKMQPKTWKKIQRAAYVFYALIYIHILVLFVPKAQKGREGYFLSVLVYSVVFVGYAVMRLRKYYVMKKKPEKRTAANAVCACSFLLPLIITGVIAHGNGESSKTVNATKDNPATFTFGSPTESTSSADEDSTVSGTSTTTSSGTSVTTSTITVTTLSSTSSGSTTSVTTTAETTDAEETSEPEENEEDQPEEGPAEDEPVQEEPQEQPQDTPQEQPAETPQPTEPQITYKYRNGTYQGTAYGYEGDVHVSITIENDVITSFSAYADEDDPEYFSDAMNTVIPQIAASVSADGIDACSGATYSSEGIIEASRQALSQALN